MAKKLCEKKGVKRTKSGDPRGTKDATPGIKGSHSGKKYLCDKCGLTAGKKKHLCKPSKL